MPPGPTETIAIKRYAHLVGGCRMAADERQGVVNADHQTFAVPNLYIVDGSVLPTQGSANPALTIMALAARCADRLVGRRPQRCPRTASMSEATVTVTRLAAAPTRSPPTGPRRTAPSLGIRPPWFSSEVSNGEHEGIGWTYAGAGAVTVIDDQLAPWWSAATSTDVPAQAEAMGRAVPQPGPARLGRVRHLGGGHRPLGPQSPSSRRGAH